MLTFRKVAYILCILVTILLWLVATEKGPCVKYEWFFLNRNFYVFFRTIENYFTETIKGKRIL